MTLKKKLLISIFALLIIVTVTGYFWNEQKKWHEATYQTEKAKVIKERFDKNPNYDDCFRLVSNYYGNDKFEEITLLGKQCIKINNTSKSNHLIFFWLASSHHHLNDEEKAIYYLKKAVDLDKENFLEKNGWIEKAGLGDIFNTIIKKE